VVVVARGATQAQEEQEATKGVLVQPALEALEAEAEVTTIAIGVAEVAGVSMPSVKGHRALVVRPHT
jgi:hypothetical protein